MKNEIFVIFELRDLGKLICKMKFNPLMHNVPKWSGTF